MILEFEGKYDFLSNFYPSPIFYDGITYPTNEHFFQAMKTLDQEERKKIAAADTPGKAKRLGRNVQLRTDWEQIKVNIMRIGLVLKFTDADLAQKLIDTGDEELIEGNWWHDNTWGSCLCQECIDRPGRNLLGMLLMELRKELAFCSKKWHIFNEHHEPLCWEGEALEFDTKESAERFLHSHIDTMYDSYEEYCETFGIIIKECVFYYEGGHLNATNKIIVYDEDDWEGHLENV